MKGSDIQSLLEKIESLRVKIDELYKDDSICQEKLLLISKSLDELIAKFYTSDDNADSE